MGNNLKMIVKQSLKLIKIFLNNLIEKFNLKNLFELIHNVDTYKNLCLLSKSKD
jgi:hypothetical protein